MTALAIIGLRNIKYSFSILSNMKDKAAMYQYKSLQN